MKRIKESAKITLTLGQLKRLVKEGFDGSTDREYAVKNLRDYACNKIIGGEAKEIMNPDTDGRMNSPLTDTREVERYAKRTGFTKVCVLGDELDFRHNSIEYTLYKKDGEYAVFCIEIERKYGMRPLHFYVVELDGELADDARMLDDSGDLQYESRKRRVNEGPGAGYTVKMSDITLTSVSATQEKEGEWKVVGDCTFIGYAEGYDWSTAETEYKGKLEWNVSDYQLNKYVEKYLPDWESSATSDENKEMLERASAYSISDISDMIGRGWSHVKWNGVLEVVNGGFDLDDRYSNNGLFEIQLYDMGSPSDDCNSCYFCIECDEFAQDVEYAYETKDEYDEEVPESVVKETAEVSDFKRDSLGCEFMGRFGSMRKPQSWVIYPKGSAPEGKVYIQCKNRWGEIDVDSGILWMSAAHGFANNMSLTIDKVKGKAEQIDLDKDIIDQIVDARDARDDKRSTGPERDTLLVVGDDEPEGKGPWSDPDYADYVR